MDLPSQKNFYDVKRQFQGKDQPTDPHPEPVTGGPARGHLLFGLIFLAVLAALFFLRVKAAREELTPTTPGAPAPAAPPKH